MKILSFSHNNQHSYGIISEKGVIDAGIHLRNHYPTLKSLLSEDPELNVLRNLVNQDADYSIDEISFLPVIENPDKILCVGMNYAAKRQEFDQHDPAPTLFVRFADSQTGHLRPVIKPETTEQFDYEGELALVIGKGGENITEASALSHIAGYSCYMDGSVRDWQHTWFTAGKNWRNTGSFGPWMTTSDEIPDPHTLSIQTWLNDLEVQNDNTANMVHRIPELVSYISTFTRLNAGDVIITGSPGGVGKKRNPPLFMKNGDRIEVGIEKIGRLSNLIVDSNNGQLQL